MVRLCKTYASPNQMAITKSLAISEVAPACSIYLNNVQHLCDPSRKMCLYIHNMQCVRGATDADIFGPLLLLIKPNHLSALACNCPQCFKHGEIDVTGGTPSESPGRKGEQRKQEWQPHAT